MLQLMLAEGCAAQELNRRGVAKEHIDAAVQQLFGEGLQVGTHIEDLTLTFHPEDGGPGSSGSTHAARSHASPPPLQPAAGQGQLGAAADPAGALLAEARRQFERSRGSSVDTRKRRLVGWLQRRGHRCVRACVRMCVCVCVCGGEEGVKESTYPDYVS